VYGGTVLGQATWCVINGDRSFDYVPILSALIDAGAKVLEADHPTDPNRDGLAAIEGAISHYPLRTIANSNTRDTTYHRGMSPRKKPVRRRKVASASVGLTAAETKQAAGAEIDRLVGQVETDGGALLGRYNDPFGGRPLLLVALPIDRVEPTPYQRDPSEAHVKRLMGVIETIGRFLDPIIAVRADGQYLTPNGNHRLQALKKLGAKTIVALLVPDAAVAFKILALNTEKTHNLREKSLETLRMARALAKMSDMADRAENTFVFEFEQPAFLTLGVCYNERPRLSGGAYQSILRRVDTFLDEPIAKAIKERERRGKKVLRLDDAVSAAVEKLKARGLTSPYLKPFVVSRVNYTRFSKATSFDFDEALDKIIASAAKFNVDRVKQEDVAKSGGGARDED
jgi:ParB family chromosome partitioning protein